MSDGLNPGALLGLPPGVPDLVFDVGRWPYVLVLVALAAGLLEARGRRAAAWVAAAAFCVLALGFWTAALGRPYGLLVDPGITRCAAEVSVLASAGGGDSLLAGEPARVGAWTWLVQSGMPAWGLLLAPSVLPMLVMPASSALVLGLWSRRSNARLASILWLAAAATDLDVLRGVGFVPGLWSRPLTSVGWVAVAAFVLVLGRLVARPAWVVGLGAVAAAALAACGGAHALSFVDGLWLLSIDQSPWLILAAVGLRRSPDPTACALAAGGATGVALAALGIGDAWAAHGFYRLGVLLAAASGLAVVGPLLADVLGLAGRWATVRGAALAWLLASSMLAWWDPVRMDSVFDASVEPMGALVESMAWVRERTPANAVFVASPKSAAAVAALGGRRVLRAPGLMTARDDKRRLRLERSVLSGIPSEALVERYGPLYVFLAPGDFPRQRLERPWELALHGRFRLVYAHPRGMSVYRLE